MDSHVRWFRREIGRRLVQRLSVETLVAVAAVVAVIAASDGGTRNAFVGAAVTAPLYASTRWVLGCLTNATSSSYLISWPQPSGDLTSVAQPNIGLLADIALTAAGLRFYDAYSEWGGATTSVYGSHDPLLATTSGDDDIQIITGFTDGRLCVSTTQLIPPHEQLIVNHQPASDVTSLLSGHRTLVETLESQGAEVSDADIEFVVDLLALEWEAWQQVGPFIAPFVDIDHLLHPSVLTVRASTSDVLAKGLSTAPLLHPPQTFPVVSATPTMPQPDPTPVSANQHGDTPFAALAALSDRAQLAAEKTDRALSGANPITDPLEDLV